MKNSTKCIIYFNRFPVEVASNNGNPTYIAQVEITPGYYQGHPTSIFGKYLFGRRFEV